MKGHELDLRVSTLPTIHGEGVVMRVLTVRASSSISTTWALARHAGSVQRTTEKAPRCFIAHRPHWLG